MVMQRVMVLLIGFILLWQSIVWIFQLPPYILPTPFAVIQVVIHQFPMLLQQLWPTLIEMLVGLILSIILGIICGLSMMLFGPIRFWLFPILIISQAIPIFAIAPLLVIWFGYGMASKIITTVLMLFFPVASAFFDGLRRTPKEWLDMATVMNGSRWQKLRHIQIPAALPGLASGIRVATAAAPIGAVIGEWVGSSRGLGFLMLNANARMQIDVMFAALFIIILVALSLYFIVNTLLRRFITWQPE